jgi:hypothetical protein
MRAPPASRAPRLTLGLALAAAAAALLLAGGPPASGSALLLVPPQAALLPLLSFSSSLSLSSAASSAGGAAPAPMPRPYEDPSRLPPLRVAMQSVWDAPPAAILDELLPLRVAAERALRRRLEPAGEHEPDLWLVGPYAGSRAAVAELAARARGRAVTLFLGIENTEGSGGRYEDLRDHLVGVTTLSLGFRRDVEERAREREPALRAAAASGAADPLDLPLPYMRLPAWLPPVVVRSNETGLAFPAALSREPLGPREAAEAAEAWARREGFAALLSSHYAFPRGELFDALSALGRVDGTGAAFHTMDWPADELGPDTGHVGAAKLAFLRRYRFNACPENSRSSDGGYTTEKMPQAHLAGAVPLYWGDAPFAEVWSEERVVRFEPGGAEARALETVRQLESNASFRAAWFARPVLRPGAGEWLAGWLAQLERLLADAFGALERAKAQAAEDRKAAGLAA